MNTRVAILVLFGSVVSIQAQAENAKPTIDVRATAEVTVPSDFVELQITVATSHSDIREAKKRNDRITTQIYELAASQETVRPKLLRTRLDLGMPRKASEWGGKGEKNDSFDDDAANQTGVPKPGKGGLRPGGSSEDKPPEPVTHMSRVVEVRFENLNQAVKFLAEPAKWESFRVTRELTFAPLKFGVADIKKHLLECRRRAVAIAKIRAKVLADESGLRLGDAIQIIDDESGSGSHRWRAVDDDPFGFVLPAPTSGTLAEALAPSTTTFVSARNRDADDNDRATDVDKIAPEQITISSTVRIVFEVHKPQ